MTGAADEERLVEKLCVETLAASDLKGICRARGFPVVGGSKRALGEGVAARFLDPTGVPEAMASLSGPSLAALHLVAASEEPVPLAALAPLLEPEREPCDVGLRALWQKVAAGLLAKGVLLADEEGALGVGEKSRFARFRLVLPETFRAFLPPFPVAAEPLEGEGERGSAREILAESLASFVSGRAADRKKAEGLPGRIACAFGIEEGALGLRGLDRPSAGSLRRWLSARWEEGLRGQDRTPRPVAAGRAARHVLGHLPPRQGGTAEALANALGALGIGVEASAVAAFCGEGTAAGLVRRFPRPRGEPLYVVAEPPEETPEGEDGLVAFAQGSGVRVEERPSPLLSLLEAARVSRARVLDGALLLEPDLGRMGRAWSELSEGRTMAALRAASPAVEEAARAVEARRGQVRVHRGLAVLRLEDAGLRAAVRTRFPGAVLEIEGAYLAVLRGSLEGVLAFARKEGYLPRRLG